MPWEVNNKKCLRCSACVGVCPFGALEFTEHGIKQDKEKCTQCGICEKFCPVNAIKVTKKDA